MKLQGYTYRLLFVFALFFSSTGFCDIPSFIQAIGGLQTSENSFIFFQEEQAIPFSIREIHSDLMRLSIQGVHQAQSPSTEVLANCLDLEIQLDQKRMHIFSINTRDHKCPIQEPHQGNFILRIADQLARKTGSQHITLTDWSKIDCQSSYGKKSTSLAFLSLVKKGQTWYQKHGYRPLDFSNDSDYEEYQSLQKRLYSYPIRDILEQLRTHQSNGFSSLPIDETSGNYLTSYKDSYLTRIKDLMFAFETAVARYELKETRNGTLSDFFSTLWDEDCTLYLDVYDLLFPPLVGIKYDWNILWEIIYDSDNMIKLGTSGTTEILLPQCI